MDDDDWLFIYSLAKPHMYFLRSFLGSSVKPCMPCNWDHLVGYVSLFSNKQWKEIQLILRL